MKCNAQQLRSDFRIKVLTKRNSHFIIEFNLNSFFFSFRITIIFSSLIFNVDVIYLYRISFISIHFIQANYCPSPTFLRNKTKNKKQKHKK